MESGRSIIPFNPVLSDKYFNGERLKAARLWRNLSSTELAKMTGFNRQTISLIENDKIDNPEFSTVQKFSETLDFPIKFFLEDIRIDKTQSTTFFRSLLTTPKKYQMEQIEKIKFISVIYKMLNEYLNFEKLDLPQISKDATPEEAAIALRKHWNLGNKPIENIIYLVEKHGLIVSEFDTSTNDVDAFSHKIIANDVETYLIGYSKNKRTAARIHFDIAHELGHILLHNWNEDLELLDKDEFKDLERQAHSFASAFLLPKEEFTRDIAPYATNLSYYTILKKRWKVSISAMIRRAKDLDIITSEDYSRLMRKMQKLGIRKIEPLDTELTTSRPSLLQQAINLLFDQRVFTPRDFLEELSTEYGLTLYSKDIENLLGLRTGTFFEEESSQVVVELKKKN